ncbi:MAG: hypothetical protein WBO76_07135, partial [Saprospiraceae bacterium]
MNRFVPCPKVIAIFLECFSNASLYSSSVALGLKGGVGLIASKYSAILSSCWSLFNLLIVAFSNAIFLF